MKSSHRLDIIGSALEFLYQKSIEKLGLNFIYYLYITDKLLFYFLKVN